MKRMTDMERVDKAANHLLTTLSHLRCLRDGLNPLERAEEIHKINNVIAALEAADMEVCAIFKLLYQCSTPTCFEFCGNLTNCE